MSSRLTYTYPGDGAPLPTDLPVLPRRWGWHAKTKQLCVVMPHVDYTDAKCAGREDLFITDRPTPEQVEQARALCDTCPVKKQCHAWALAHEEFGIWAGTTPDEREVERKALHLKVIEPASAHVFGLNEDPIRPSIPEQCKNGHYLKHRYDAVTQISERPSPYRTEFRVDCSQCYYERLESPEARAALGRMGKLGAIAIKERGTRNTPRANKWGAA